MGDAVDPDAADAITRLLGRYCDLVDAGEWDQVGDLFASGRLAGEDGTPFASGASEIAAFYRRSTRMHDGSPRTKHLVLGIVLSTGAAGMVEAHSSYVVLQAIGGALQPIITGRYHDTFRPEAGGWVWVERCFTVELTGDLTHHLTWSPKQ